MSIANHFEPLWAEASIEKGVERLSAWIEGIESLGRWRDAYGQSLKHTYFYPVEQYDWRLMNPLVAHCRRGFGEIEVHLHHGVDRPDTAEGLRQALISFLDTMEDSHRWRVRDPEGQCRGYAFVHGNWALGNSAGGACCGVDEEVAVLVETGCYVDMTMPSAPDPTQVPTINAIYVPGGALDRPVPHRRGRPLCVGMAMEDVRFFLVQGPLVWNWRRRKLGLPVPRLENGELGVDYPPTLERFRLWMKPCIGVRGRPDWLFVKLHCHGLQERHMPTLAGEGMGRFLDALFDYGRSEGLTLHFVTAREMANIALAAVGGAEGDPDRYRDFYWRLLPEN